MAEATDIMAVNQAVIAEAPEGVRVSEALFTQSRSAGGEMLCIDSLSFVAMLQRRFAPTGNLAFAAECHQDDYSPEGQPVRKAGWTVYPAIGDQGQLDILGPVAVDLGLAAHGARQTALVRGVASTEDLRLALCDWSSQVDGLEVDGKPMVSALFHAGLHLWLNHDAAAVAGQPLTFVLKGIETPAQARLWNDIFLAAGEALDVSGDAIKVVLPINTRQAALQAEELVFALKDHVSGLVTDNNKYLPILAGLGQKRLVPVYVGGDANQDMLAAMNVQPCPVAAEKILAAFAH